MITKEDIVKAWKILRKAHEAQSIPSETLDFIKDVSLKALERVKEYGELLTLEEAVSEPGWYVAESFVDGVCMEIGKFGETHLLCFANKEDFAPIRETMSFYPGLLKKKFKKVFNRYQLFRKD